MERIIHTLPSWVLWLGFALMPFLAIAGGLGIAPLGALAGLTGWAVLLQRSEAKTLITRPWFLSLCALLIWCMITQTWSPYTAQSLLSNPMKVLLISLIFCGVGTAFQTLRADSYDKFRHIFMAGGVFAAGLMLIEIVSGFGLSILVDPVQAGEILHTRQADAEQNLGRGILVYVQFLPLLALLLVTQVKRGWMLALLVVGLLILTAHFNRLSLTSYVIMISFIAMVITWKFPKFGIITVFIVVMTLIISGPLIGFVASQVSDEQLLKLPLSLEHRIRMWAYAWEQILQHPWLGNGFDASRSYQDKFLARGGREIVIVSLHPHNAAVHIWLEIGAIGAVLAVTTLAMLMNAALKFARLPLQASALVGTMTAVALFGLTTIGVWQVWWWGSIFIAIGALSLWPKYQI